MKYIDIFIGSSIVELELERAKLMSFLQGLNNKYAERGTFIRGYICEETSAAMMLGGSQKRYNDYIESEADAAVFLFFHKAGEYTLEELKLAREAFLRQNRPNIFVFFKSVNSAPDVNEEIQRCIKLVSEEYGHYYKVFDNIDTVKLELLQFLSDFLPGNGEVLIKDGVVWMDGEAVESISTANVFAYQNNPDLKRLKDKANGLERLMRAASEKGDKSAALRISAQLENVRKEYRELEKAILDALVFFRRQNRQGVKADALLQEALTQLELGDIEAAKALIPQEALDRMAENVRKRRALAEEQLRPEEAKLLEYTRARVRILLADITNPERFQQVENAYGNALDAAKSLEDFGLFYDYSTFLFDQKNYSKGIDIAERLRHIYDDPEVSARVDDLDRANLLNLLGRLYWANNQLRQAEPAYLASLELKKNLCLANPSSENESIVAKANNNLAILYANTGRRSEAETLFLASLESSRRLYEAEHLASYRQNVAQISYNLGLINWSAGKADAAEKLLYASLDIYRSLNEASPNKAFTPDVADLLYSLAGLYRDNGKPDEAEKLFLEALACQRRLAAEVNPQAYEPNAALTCYSLAVLYANTGRPDEAEALYSESLEAFRRLLEEFSQKAYEPYVAELYRSIAKLYAQTGRTDEAEKLYLKSLAMMRKFVKELHREGYEPELALVLFDLGNLYQSMQRAAEQSQCHSEAKEIAQRYAEADVRCRKICDQLSEKPSTRQK